MRSVLKRVRIARLSVMTVAVSLPLAAHAITIVPKFDTSITTLANAAQVEADIKFVAADFGSALSGAETINVAFSWGSLAGERLPSNAVGASLDTMWGGYTYSSLVSSFRTAALGSHGDAALTAAAAHLAANDPTKLNYFYVPQAEAKALGLAPAKSALSDGSIAFAGTTANFTFGAGAPTSTTYDFRSVVAHEMAEVLGRVSGLQSRLPYFATPFDLFRYSSPGVNSFTFGAAGTYISIDGGKTSLGLVNTSSGYDQSDLKPQKGVYDIQNALIVKGQTLSITAGDITALEALGYGAGAGVGSGSASPTTVLYQLGAQGVPEPGSFALAGLMSAAGLIVRTRRAR